MGDKKDSRILFALRAFLTKSPETLLIFAVMLLLTASKGILSVFVGNDIKYCAASITLSIFCFLIPSLVYLYLAHFGKGRGIPDIGLNAPSLISIPAVVASLFLMISGSILIVLLGLKSEQFIFSVYSAFIPGKSYSFGAILLMVAAYALIPAFFEELLFRGVLCSVYNSKGYLPSFVLPTLFFALAHLNAAGIPVFLFSGLILWLLFYATKSLYVTIAVHFFYNLFCMFGLPYISAYYGDSFDPALFMFVITLIFLLSATIFCGSNAWIYKKREISGDDEIKYSPVAFESIKYIGNEFSSAGFVGMLAVYIIYSIAS